MKENILHYFFVFCTKYKKPLLIDSLHPDILNFTYKYCYENSMEMIALTIRDKHTMILEIKTANVVDSPQAMIANLKNYVASELRNKHPFLKTKSPSLWTRQNFIQTLGTVQEDAYEEFILVQKGVNE